MDIGVIAKRYARALLQYALEEGAEDTVYDEVRQFILDYAAVPRLREVMHDPQLPPAEKERLLCQAASTDASPILRRFVALVVAHHREAFMLFIAHSYVDLYRRHKGIRIARLTTAVPVGEATQQRLSQWAATQVGPTADTADGANAPAKGTKAAPAAPAKGADAPTIQLETAVDPDLLGGFIFQIDDRRLDASVATQFRQIKKQFIEKNKRIV